MRVIAGEFRSRTLKTLPGMDTRPTPDRLREALFNILASEIADKVFLDAYAGTGAVGIEALSRGARRAIFIERAREAVDVIRENLTALKIRDRADVVKGKVLQYLPHRPADIVFLDPPYALQGEYASAMNLLAETSAPLVLVQYDKRLQLQPAYGSLQRVRVLNQGDNSVSFYRRADPTSDAV